MSHLARDRALAMRVLMPRAGETLPPYTTLDMSMRRAVDRLVESYREVRRDALAQLAAGTVGDGSVQQDDYERAQAVVQAFQLGGSTAEHITGVLAQELAWQRGQQ